MTHSVTSLKVTIAALSLLGLTACTETKVAYKQTSGVEEAFLSSDAVAVKPYTRTIFSSNNF